jgi:hypothetical protein
MIAAMEVAINRWWGFPQVVPTLNSRQLCNSLRVPEFLGDIKGLEPIQKA